MAAIVRTARAVRNMHMIRVAGFRTTSQAGLDRTSCSPVPNYVVPASGDLGFTSPAWYRDTSISETQESQATDKRKSHASNKRKWSISESKSITAESKVSAYSRGFATKEGDIESEEKRVESKVRDELGEPEGGSTGAKDAARHAVSKVGQKVKDAGKAIKSSTGMDSVGNSVEDAGDTLKDKGSAQMQTLGKEDVVTS